MMQRRRAGWIVNGAILTQILVVTAGCDLLKATGASDTNESGQSVSLDSLELQWLRSENPGDEASYQRAFQIDAEQGTLLDLRVIVSGTATGMNFGPFNVTVRHRRESTNYSLIGGDDSINGDVRQTRRSVDFQLQLPDQRPADGLDIEISVTTNGAGSRDISREIFVPVALTRRVLPPTEAAPTQVSASFNQSLAIDEAGQVWAWGNNLSLTIDQVTSDAVTAPRQISIPEPIRSLSSGLGHSLAVSTTNRVYGWGSGFGSSSDAVELVDEINDAAFAIAGSGTSFVVSNSGELYTWGGNANGIAGRGLDDTRDTPTLVPMDPITKVAVGAFHALALTTTGEVWAWGESNGGRLGASTGAGISDIRRPQKSTKFQNITDIAATQNISFLVTDAGEVLFFGLNDNNLFFGDSVDVDVDVRRIESVDDAVGVVAGYASDSIILIRRNLAGDIYYSAAGENGGGQLLLPPEDVIHQLTDTEFPFQPDAFSIGTSHGLFVKREGNCAAVWSWGLPDDGRLGRPSFGAEPDEIPYPVPMLGSATCSVLSVSTENNGRIRSTPGDIDCGPSCTAVFASGDTVVLDASQRAESFLGFDGYCSLPDGGLNRTLPLSTEINAHAFCRAHFSPITGTSEPVANILISPASPVDLGQEVTFDGSSSTDADGAIVSWDWDLTGDGVTDASGEVVTFTYATEGFRAISLTVTDNDGLAATSTTTIQVATTLSMVPTASFAVSPAGQTVLGTPLTLDASASTDDVGISSWEWDFGNDGSIDATGEVVNYTPSDVGQTMVRLRVTDADSQFDEAIQTVTVVADTPTTFTLRVVIDGSGFVDIAQLAITFPNSDCDGNECFVFGIPSGTVLTLSSFATTPAVFQGWNSMECDEIQADLCRFTMTADRSVVATFR